MGVNAGVLARLELGEGRYGTENPVNSDDWKDTGAAAKAQPFAYIMTGSVS